MTFEFRGHRVREAQWTLAGRCIRLTWPAAVCDLLDAPGTRERFERDEYMPYWAEPWPASILLAERILTSEPGGGRLAIELGCGVGLVSLAAAIKGWSVIASDYDADAIAFAEYNARANGMKLAGTALVDIREPPDRPSYDAVFAADLTYEERNSAPLARWIASALRREGRAMVTDPNRAVSDVFPDHARAAGLRVDVAVVQTSHPDGLPVRGRIWTLSPRVA